MKVKDLNDKRADDFVWGVEMCLKTYSDMTIEDATSAVKRHCEHLSNIPVPDEDEDFNQFVEMIKQTDEYKFLVKKYSDRNRNKV